jgi:hypothetical protein
MSVFELKNLLMLIYIYQTKCDAYPCPKKLLCISQEHESTGYTCVKPAKGAVIFVIYNTAVYLIRSSIMPNYTHDGRLDFKSCDEIIFLPEFGFQNGKSLC